MFLTLTHKYFVILIRQKCFISKLVIANLFQSKSFQMFSGCLQIAHKNAILMKSLPKGSTMNRVVHSCNLDSGQFKRLKNFACFSAIFVQKSFGVQQQSKTKLVFLCTSKTIKQIKVAKKFSFLQIV